MIRGEWLRRLRATIFGIAMPASHRWRSAGAVSRPARRRRRRFFAELELLEARTLLSASVPEFVDPHPAPGNQFGATVVPLSTGNVVVTSPNDDAGGENAGAVYLFNGETGELISTLTGSHANDHVGASGVTEVGIGNFVIRSIEWDSGGATDVGAVTWGDGHTGVSGVVSSDNSLVGSTDGDQVGGQGIIVLENGNYLVRSSYWDNGGAATSGAVTWGDGNSGVTGVVSSSNSLVGSSSNDSVGSDGVTLLGNGNYVVRTSRWDNGAATDAGAVTWGDGTTGISGEISSANSLVGSTTDDFIGLSGFTVLADGDYVVSSSSWDNGAATNAGAVTWGDGTTGIAGVVSSSNSLVGNSSDDDVGNGGVTALTNGNYVVKSINWNSLLLSNVGAVTWGDGDGGTTGIVSGSNSLVGSLANDHVGSGGVTALSNGNYVVQSASWDNVLFVDAGAVTWGDGETGITGVITVLNSLIGSSANDQVGDGGVTALANGNYIVNSYNWDNLLAGNAGAVTWADGTAGIAGVISSSNSLVGNQADDHVGYGGITVLPGGDYVVRSHYWNNGGATQAGAVTWGDGTAGITGVVSSGNSLVGTTEDDRVGLGGVTVLANGNYVVKSNYWNNGAATQAGAVTWGDGTTGITGVVSSSNSLVGSTMNDYVGLNGIIALTNGNYVVSSSNWDNGGAVDAGAATWGDGTAGITGAISSSNSLVGSATNDRIGLNGVTALTNGNYLVKSSNWNNGAASQAGAVTWGNGTTGTTGVVSSSNSLVGSTTGDQVGGFGVIELANGNYVVQSAVWDNGAVSNAGAVTWGDGTTGISGVISSDNSLVGSQASDFVGLYSIIPLDNGNYLIPVPSWDNGNATNAGAFAFGNGVIGTSGDVSSDNSVVGTVDNASLQSAVVDNVNGNYFARFLNEDGINTGGVVYVRSQLDGLADTPPVLDLEETSATYIENASPVSVGGGASASDASGDWTGGSLTVQITNAATSNDQLSIVPSGSLSFNASNVQYSGTTIGTALEKSVSGGSVLMVSLNENATNEAVQALVQSITFSNASDDPATDSRTVTFSLTNAAEISAIDTRSVTVVAENDAPVIANFGPGFTFTEGAPPRGIATTATLADPDNANFQDGSLVITITSGGESTDVLTVRSAGLLQVSGSDVQYDSVSIGTLTPGSGDTALQVDFNENATPEIVEMLLHHVTFATTSQNPSASDRMISAVLNDGTNDSSPVTTTIAVTPVDDAPVIDNFDTMVFYWEHHAARLLDQNVVVTDIDSANFSGGTLTVELTANGTANDRLAIRNEGIGPGQIGLSGSIVLYSGAPIGSFSGGTEGAALTISLNANANAENVQELLRKVTYDNSSDDPATLDRTVQVTLSDGAGMTSLPKSKTIRVEAINDAPEIAGFPDSADYIEGDAPVVLGPDATITDPDTDNYDGGELIVSLTQGSQSFDRLSIRNQGTAGGEIGVSGDQITYGGTVIGSFSGGFRRDPLTVSLNGDATPTAVQALLKNITFAHEGDDLRGRVRSVEIQLTDGNGVASNLVEMEVEATAGPDAPVLGNFTPGGVYRETYASILIDNDVTVVDADSRDFDGGVLTIALTENASADDLLGIRASYRVTLDGNDVLVDGAVIGTLSGGPAMLTIALNVNATPLTVEALLRRMTFTNISENPATETRTLQVTLSDGDGQSSEPVSKSIDVISVDDAPVIEQFDTPLYYREGWAPHVIDPNPIITDVDSSNFDGGVLTVEIVANGQMSDVLAIRDVGTGPGEVGLRGNNVTYEGTVIGTCIGGHGRPLVVTFNGNADAMVVQELLTKVTFANNSRDVSELDRMVQVTLTDGDGGTSVPVSKTIQVDGINDPPVLGDFGPDIIYREGRHPSLIDSDMTVESIDSADFDGGTLTVALLANAASDDLLGIRESYRITLDGNDVLCDGMVIGSFTGGAQSTPLTVSLNSNATASRVQTLLRRITFENTSENPSDLDRTVQVTLSDGDGGISIPVTKSIQVIPED